MSKIIQWLFLNVWLLSLKCEVYNDRPKIKTSNGNLYLVPAFDKNIYLSSNGPKSTIFIGNVDISTFNASSALNQPYDQTVTNNNDLSEQLNGANGILRRLDNLESTLRGPSLGVANVTALSRKVNRLQNQVTNLRALFRDLGNNKCNIRPCENGGTCLDLALSYHCLCPSNWEGRNCDIDVNECRNFAGTELGCQNGATCINKPGSYECLCRSGWYGLHCTRKAKDCSGGDFEMCGHGTCVPVSTGEGIKCICNQGWTTNGTGPACNTDIDECQNSHGPHCSINPKVDCINTPGSFQCGPCPVGYDGDGYVCSDIDECTATSTPNGGCSTSPMVPCYNTIGSRICGPCPSGYQGDGTACVWRGSCRINRGGCHPSAQCIENSGLGGQAAICMCPEGMEGDGVGLNGCYVSTDGNSTLHCENNPCGSHGRCHPLPKAYTCFCDKGYGGAHCESLLNYCSENHCLNGGTCMPDETSARGFRCECTAQYSGDLCQSTANTCGGVLDAQEGSIVYPFTNISSYSHNSRCAWVIHTAPNKVINVTFSKFDIEFIQDCAYDFLQIHDGRSSASQLIGRFCGKEFPKGGNIISSHNNLYFWFRSDQTVAKDGFALHWNTIDPICGGEVNVTSHGHISSPGWPGKYPPNRDCYWHLTATLGKRIQLHFFQLDIESHANCSYDYLEIYDGDSLLTKYCSSSDPAPVHSTGSEMLIHFHSDAFESGNGFQISYATAEGVPGCGGLFTADKGEITPPSYNGKYLSNMLCDYQIRVARDTKIRITFESFKLETSFRCKYDYVKIYDGISSDAKLVGKFCGNTYPKNYLSSSNTLKIQFKSDRSNSQEGFKIAYETVCHHSIFGNSGQLMSPDYPHNYPANRICEYIITTIPGKAIQLTFQDFDIEDNNYYNCQYDNVQIRDGPDINSTLLGQFCGDSTHMPPVLTSTMNYMYIRFNSDLSVSGTGFLANFTTIDVPCGGIYKDLTGMINYPSTDMSEMYRSNQNCTWIFVAPPGHHIKLSWNRFDIEQSSSCSSDYLELTEIDENNEINSFGKFCGTRSPPTLTTSTNRLAVHFFSDSSIGSLGFSVFYAFLDMKTHCGGMYVKTSGVIVSPGWPNTYEPNRDCEWIITVPVGRQISLNISLFDLERSVSSKCDYGDYLEIRNGASQTSPLIGKFCGTVVPRRLTSLGNSFYLHFRSDYYLGGKGFKLQWDGTVSGCGGTLTGSTGSVTSPNYPDRYADNAECFYKIVTSLGSRIKIMFVDLDLEKSRNCQDDYIEIYDGYDSNANILGRYCSLSPLFNIKDIETTSNFAFVKFRSDILIGGKGFHFSYYTVCNNNLTGSYGVIESPNYPNKNLNILNCIWTITVPKGNRINITFTHFDIYKHPTRRWWGSPLGRPYEYQRSSLSANRSIHSLHEECSASYIQIRDGTEGPFNTKICGSSIPAKTTTKNNVIQIKFYDGGIGGGTGFRLEWVKDGCGGHFVKQFGSIAMPNYKTTNAGQLECEWNIETTPGKAVQITFSDVYMKETKNCTTDALEIYDGQNVHTPLITKICHRGIATYQTTTNFMLIRFVKQSDFRDVSFAGEFTSVKAICGGSLQSHSGTIYSPNYPKNYDNNLDCIWYITIPMNHRIIFNILDLDLYSTISDDATGDDNNALCDDSIKIYDSNDIINTNYTYKICAHTHIKQIISKSNSLDVQFTTNNVGTAKGFKANFTLTCGGRITVKNDGILTNDKLYNEHSNRSCIWTIVAAKNDQKISFTLTYMNIPKNDTIITNRHCPSSFLKVLDGNDAQAPLLSEICGRKVPPMIVSHGNALTIELGSYTGFTDGQFSAHYTTIDSACGGTLTSEEGSLASPNYPDAYPVAASCEWILSTSPGNQVFLTFETFNIEKSDNCNEDYLEIRENDGAGRLIDVYCGSDIPINTTIASKIYVKFFSDTKGSGQGFLAHYGFIHGSEITDVEHGEITSPLFPNYYEGSGEYTWRIMTNGMEPITLTIKKLEIVTLGSQCHNSLSVYDGYDEDGPLLQEMCGLLTTNNRVIKTTSGTAFLKLKLDESNSGSIFRLIWSSQDSLTSEIEDENINCGSNGTLLVTPGTSLEVNSPNYGVDTYGNLLNCEWLFRSAPGFHLKLLFADFVVESNKGCTADYVSIYSSSTGGQDWKPIQEHMCEYSSETIASNFSNHMKLKFISDQSLSYKGFNGIVTAQCGGLLTDPSGVIEVNWDCWNQSSDSVIEYSWKVKVKPGRTIQTQFEYFNITSQIDYCSNYIKLHNGESKESPMLGSGKYCGYAAEDRSQVLITSSNSLFVIYRSQKHTFQYFKIRYEENAVECGATSKLDSDHPWETISSPNYPSVPVPYSECIWIFTGPPGEILRIDFIERFDLEWDAECNKESLDVRDGATESSLLKGRFCQSNPGTIKTSNNVMFVKYFTQISEPRNGFKANISIDVCGGTIMANDGELISPGYPHMKYFPAGTVCEWKVIGLSGHVFQITPLDISLPESETQCGTKITIEESAASERVSNILKTYCDFDSAPFQPIDTFSNEFILKFTIGTSSEYTQLSDYQGYRIKFNSTVPSCGGVLTASVGFISTPGYPRETKLRYCQWLITSANPERRMKLEILDAEFSTDTHRIGIYNDHSFQSAIQNIPSKDWDKSQMIFESSGNTLAVYLWLSPLANEHRFKARFSAFDESLCGGTLEGDAGELMSPTIDSSYFCEWRYKHTAANVTSSYDYNTLYVNIKLNTTSPRTRCRYSDPKLRIDGNIIRPSSFMREMCDNTETSYRIPSFDVVFKAIKGKGSFLSFRVIWKKQPCGGLVEVGEEPIDILKLPNNHTGSLDCAWIIRVPLDNRIELQLQGSFISECTEEFLTINQGYTRRSSLIGDYCKDRLPSNSIGAHFRSMYIQYHTSDYKNTTNLKVIAKTTNSPCGGYLDKYDTTFTSPNYPKRYIENQECSWLITTDLGQRITLTFIERFVIEDKPNCTSDAVIIYDWKDDDFTEIGKVCGRILPPNFNSTYNKMKVVFRSNSEINLDGFKAHWKTFCGGKYEATDKEQFIYSPGYPNEYSGLLDCTYHITSPNGKVFMQFLELELEGTYPICNYDNLTITGQSDYNYDYQVYCGNEAPKPMTNFETVDIMFKTDRFTQKKGFKLSYQQFTCNKVVKEPTILTLGNNTVYDGSLNCTWTIEAPKNKVVVIKFDYIDVEENSECSTDYLVAYEGLDIASQNIIATLCGYLNSTTVIRSTGNTLVLQFVSDFALSYSGFKAEVSFSYSKSVGCGGKVDLMNTTSQVLKSPLIGNKVVYEDYLDCFWTISTQTDKVIQAEFTSFHVSPCKGVNQTAIGFSNCNCDYIEILDGINPNSLLIGKFCGHNLPPKLSSSGNSMSLRLYTDGDLESAGFVVKLTVRESECQQNYYNTFDSIVRITSPGYEKGNIPRGLHCSYYIEVNSPYAMTHVIIKNLDLQPGSLQTNECDKDKLVISNSRTMNNKTFGSDLIISQSRDNFFSQGVTTYEFTYAIKNPKKVSFCGKRNSVDLYNYGNFKINILTAADSTSNNYKGFEIEVKELNWCGRNYTESDGRIQSLYSPAHVQNVYAQIDCYTLISAPENYTISLYFMSLNQVPWSEIPYLEIFDGNSSDATLLKKTTTTYEEVNAIFSTGRYLLLHNHRAEDEAVSFDMNYVTTNKGRGCGGKLHNVAGLVTSPMYPDIYRKVATCEWELETPFGSNLVLHFKIFSLGKTCDQNYLQLVDRDGKVYSTYCEEVPADFRSPNNYVKIVYKTTRNNGGQGWVAEFIATD